jgi:hypothetical protein
LVFGYVPAYGKFGLFNKYIVHWDVPVTGGVGVIWTEIIPVIPGDSIFGGPRIAPHLGIATRMFVTDWLALSVGLRDYGFLDKFEPLNRHSYTPDPNDPNSKRAMTPDEAKRFATSSFTQNLMFFASIAFYLPPSFQYKTAR